METRRFYNSEWDTTAELDYFPDLGAAYGGKNWWIKFSNTDIRCYKTEAGAIKAIKKFGYVEA